MLRLRPYVLILAVAGLLAAPAASAAQPSEEGATAYPLDDAGLAKVIVALDGEITSELLDQLEGLGVTRALELPSIDALAVTAPVEVAEALPSLPGVIAVQGQRRIELNLYASVDQINGRGVDETATYERDGETYERPGVNGEGVTVGVIDSGIFAEHPGLSGRVTLGLNFEFTELQDSGGIPVEVWDAYAESTGASALQDEVGHGTHVAGIVGGDGSGAQSFEPGELAGVAPGVEFVSLKIASAANGVIEDVGFEENALAAIDYLIRHPELGVALTNNSWGLLPQEPSQTPVGEETDFDAAQEVTRAAVEAGLTMVFAAGNDGPETDTIGEDPGGIDEALTIAAACKQVDGSCEAPGITDFSSRGAEDGTGAQVDVAAPGDRIFAPVSPSILAPLSECESRYTEEPGYYCLSGTSMAAPHVAGVAALMEQANPDITPAETERCLIDTADDMLTAGFDIHSGYGMVNTEEALICAHQLTGPEAVGGGDDTAAPAPEPTPETQPAEQGSLPSTGGGLALVGLAGLAGALATRRRRS